MAAAGDASTLGDLFEAMDHVAAGVEGLRERTSSPDAIIHLARINDAVEAVSGLKGLDMLPLPPNQVALALVDAENVARMVNAVVGSQSSGRQLEIAALLTDRIMRNVGYLALMSKRMSPDAPASDGIRSESCDPSERTLQALSLEYGADANREQTVVRVIYGGALVLFLGAVALALIGILDARQQDAFLFSRFVAYGIVSLAVVAFAAIALRQAAKHRLAEQEARRLQRHLQGLDPYLLSMPRGLRDLLRATLVASLFSRLPSEEPWREPRWPEPDSLLDAMRISLQGNPTDSD
jgi:hypothetical protein